MNNKKELLKLRTLRPTDKMMNMAANDVPIIKPCWWNKNSYENIYKHSVFMRCQILNGIMKIALFMTEYMRCGSKEPLYEIFIDYENEQFITYDCKKKKWSDAMLSNLSFPGAYEHYSERKSYINPEGKKSIKNHLKVKTGDFKGIVEYQTRIRKIQLDKKNKKITDPWDEDLSQIPALPKDWDKWVRRVGITDHYIFYKYERNGAKEGFCTRCGKTVPIKNAKNGKVATCSCCRKPIQYKSYGKMGTYFASKEESVYLIQKCRDGFVTREFSVQIKFQKNKDTQPHYNCFEYRRCIYESFDKARAYFWGDFKHREFRWVSSFVCSHSSIMHKAKIYGKTLCGIPQLKRTGMLELIRHSEKIDPEVYIAIYKDKPYMERIAKAGLYQLCLDFIDQNNHYYFYADKFISDEATNGELHKLLQIDKQLLKRLRSANGGIAYLEWLQYEKARNRCISDKTISWFTDNHIKPDSIKFITDRMSENKICKYMKQQVLLSKEKAKFILDTWQDYLEMAKRLNINVAQEINYKPRYLVDKHNECIEKIGSADTARAANEISAQYPDVDNICQSIVDKYEFAGEKFTVVVPKRIEDILNDSNELNHCVSRSPDRYFERIQNRESYILLLRKSNNLDKPYYTLEVEPNGTVRQTRTKHNTQGKDIGEIKEFLIFWQKEISKRLTEDDMLLGNKSNEIRLQEYKELRDKKAIIRGGTYQGKLLADVLEADLLINNRRCS